MCNPNMKKKVSSAPHDFALLIFISRSIISIEFFTGITVSFNFVATTCIGHHFINRGLVSRNDTAVMLISASVHIN